MVRENLHKRYLVHVAGYNLGLIMRFLVGAGTPRELVARTAGRLLVLTAADGAVIAILTLAAQVRGFCGSSAVSERNVAICSPPLRRFRICQNNQL